MPKITGTVTIKNIFIDMLINEIFLSMFEGSSRLADVKTINGIVKTHNKLIIAVSDIDRATSPFAKCVSKFEVTPPGAAAIIITPTANAEGIGNILTSAKAIIGNKIICKKDPTKKSRGCFATLKKSAPVKPKPRTNIIKAKAKGRIISVTTFICVSIKIL